MMDKPSILSLPKIGSSVIVRCLQAEDLSEMYRIESDPEVKRYLNGPTRVPREEWIRGMESKFSRCQTLAVLAKDSGQFAGRAALDLYLDSDYLDAEVTREIQVVISKDNWGRHFGREVCKILIAAAFDDLDAEQVIGVVHPQNENCLKLLHIFGFEQNGVISKLPSWQHGHLRFVLPRSVYV
jgi:RimJ/RimL family protein N-acetyltransferase